MAVVRDQGITMLVRFSSVKTDSIVMFGDVGVQLIRMLGGSGNIPGAIEAEDIPAAVARLKGELKRLSGGQPEPAAGGKDDETEHETPVALATRALPLIDLLNRAAAAKAAVMWERG